MNRRIVAQNDKVYAAFGYRRSPLTIADAATGKTLHEVKLDGVDEIVARGDLVICRVRPEIPMPKGMFRNENVGQTQEQLKKDGFENPREELAGRVMDLLREQKNEQVVAVDAGSGAILWKHDAPTVGTQSLALSGDKVVFHNYEALVALDAKSGKPVWTYPCPVQKRTGLGPRNLLGNLLIADGKVLWSSSATGGGVCLALADGKELWKHPHMGTTGGFGFPTALRSVHGVVWNDYLLGHTLADGTRVKYPDIGDMMKRGHHIRCFAGKATEHYLILPERGAEFIDLKGDNHMPCDWFRGGCSYGLMPANGMIYGTPDPCSCYAGARIIGFFGLSAALPSGLAQSPAPDAPARLVKGPAFDSNPKSAIRNPQSTMSWPSYLQNARRTGFASTPLSPQLQTGWSSAVGGALTQATIADNKVYLVNKATYELWCLNLADGKSLWRRSFPGGLDGPPTVVGARLFIGCQDGSVHALRASDGELVWRFQVAPLDRLTLSDDRIENVWPVSSSVLFHNGLIYAAAGRNSYLDGGIRLCALDPATGQLRHHSVLEGPWPDKETVRTAVANEHEVKMFSSGDPSKIEAASKALSKKYATGYSIHGGSADLLVTDGTDLYMTQNKFDPQLQHIPLQRAWITGYTPMGGLHLLANFGILDDTMYHRTSRVFDNGWPSYGSGPGTAARGGSFVAVGDKRAYAAQHYEGGGYAMHKPGSGNRIVADAFDTENLPGDLLDSLIDDDTAKKEDIHWSYKGLAGKVFSRKRKQLWKTPTPVIIRAMLGASDGQGGELVFAAGIVEGKTVEEWDKSTYYEGPGKLQVFNGADGKLLAEYDLPACPVFDGLSAADGQLLIPMVNGQIQAMKIKQ